MAHILLIEPDAVMARLYSETLEQAGHTIKWVRTAQAAIHASDSLKVDTIILELQLARHNGVEFLYEFRTYPEWRDIPVIVLSRIPMEEIMPREIQRALNIRSFHYKPQVRLRQLKTIVDDALSAPVI